MMASLGAANSLLGGNVGAINAQPRGAATIQAILGEVAAALTAIGRPPRQAVVEQLAETFGAHNSHQTTSLYRNMLAGRSIELQPILGDLLDGVPDPSSYPLLLAAYARLAIYEAGRSGLDPAV